MMHNLLFYFNQINPGYIPRTSLKTQNQKDVYKVRNHLSIHILSNFYLPWVLPNFFILLINILLI